MDGIYRFSAPGRTEICGNHTDHQHGCVLAAAVNLEARAEVQLNGSKTVRVISDGYAPIELSLDELDVRTDERNTTAALVRGVAAGFVSRGCKPRGFDAHISSSVLAGSGLSSSAAFEVLMGRIFNGLFFDGRLTPAEIAQIGQYAENVYFGKPCGLMDQMASSMGGLVYIDFGSPDSPYVEKIDFDFSHCGYTLCIIDSGADHAALTGEYASIPHELSLICSVFGKHSLRDVDESEFYARLPELRHAAGDRAVLRAMHVFDENRRVALLVQALKSGDFDSFLSGINHSGLSSWLYLQNVTPSGGIEHQDMAFTLALCRRLLNGRGAVRIHGGGFAGTALAFVPDEEFLTFSVRLEAVLGAGSCHRLEII